jgi:hypothetical protein
MFRDAFVFDRRKNDARHVSPILHFFAEPPVHRLVLGEAAEEEALKTVVPQIY